MHRAIVVAVALLASCARTTPLPPPLPADQARSISSGLRISTIVAHRVVENPWTAPTPEACIVDAVVVEALRRAADEVEAAADQPACLPELDIVYGHCLDMGDQSLPLEALDVELIVQASDEVVDITVGILDLSRVRERDCVGYEVGVNVLAYVGVDVVGALLPELAPETHTGRVHVQRHCLGYDTCLPSVTQ